MMQQSPDVLDNLDLGVPWTTGLFDCFQHPTNAIMTAYLPCVTFGQIAELLDEGEMNCALGSYIYLAMMPALCSHWLMGSKYRAKLRMKYHLVEAPFPDMVFHIYCPCCALAQEFRELNNRGLDPSLGWRQIVEQQMENPPPDQFMAR
ncbi:protein PLANT CADMIUM RESISTANCE 8-like [Rhodamnia argentea]|uniref:Protein PLANT CADMIUM RESISTANCE 8-like n=1 Tax=Rhodamnia argentea TaxID=178133 RepID=A0A8B8NU56_9MYRT|nr:protein PLANT CADMIUM RESISTANCE 8-like [Rhodamnia argentea]